MKKPNQVFILGAPRSGTTFLASLLSLTSYGAPFETQFIPKYFKKFDVFGDINNFTNFSKILDAIMSERAVMQWKLDINKQEFFDSFNGNVNYADLVNKLCAMNGRMPEGKLGEKTPWYLLELPMIVELFPKAKFIYIIRDGRDVALSLLEKDWGPNNIYTCAEYWKRLNAQTKEFDMLENNGQLIRLRYEDLLNNPEEYVFKIYKFLDEPLNNEALEPLIKRTKGDNFNKWKSKMTTKQIALFESVAGETLKRFGYETNNVENSISSFKECLYRIHDKLVWLRFMFKTNVVDGIRIKFFGKEPFAD